jgi:hypothetical protein
MDRSLKNLLANIITIKGYVASSRAPLAEPHLLRWRQALWFFRCEWLHALILLRHQLLQRAPRHSFISPRAVHRKTSERAFPSGF